MPMDAEYSALIVDDDAGVRQSIRLCLEADGARALGVGSASAALEAVQRSVFDVVLLDLWLGSESGLTTLPTILKRQPGVGVVVITAFATFETAVEAMKLGASDYLPKPFTPDQVRRAARRVVAANSIQKQQAEIGARIDAAFGELYDESRSPSYRMFLDGAARAAATDSVVLLTGESGTGKTVLARWMHAHSSRAQRPFVTVHCPSLAGDLMSSALFGHRKGAFTGAVADSPGKVDEAEGGTLFLDEVGDLAGDAQARLLRFLHDQTYERLGEARDRKADVRVIAATNRPLDEEVKEGRFREDLFFRLNVIPLTLPPLRQRREDAVPLALHYLRFFERSRGRHGLTLSSATEKLLATYAWPGNLRELRNAIERAVVFAPGSLIELDSLGLGREVAETSGQPGGPPAPNLGDDASLDDIEREHIARVVARAETLEAAARTLGIDPTTLQRKRKRYGLL